MRLVWWMIFLAIGCVSAVQARTPDADDASTSDMSKLVVSPSLQLHKGLNEDQMSAFLIADKIESDPDGKVTLTGSAEVRRLDTVVKGDHIDYQRNTGQVHVVGNGLLMRAASIVTGPSLTYNVKSKTGEIDQPHFWLGATGGSGKADEADILSHNDMRLKNVTYTGCACLDPAWYIESSKVDLHFQENEGVAHNGVLYFKGVPILASPYLTFPIRKERKSGLLLPTYGISSNAGVEYSQPYYFNLAPNYDATLTPRYMTKRGWQLGGQFRYLGPTYSGQISGTYLSKDRQTGDDRWMYIVQHEQSFGGGFSAAFDVRHVSDDDYFRDFSTLGLSESTTDLLPSSATLSWNGSPYWSASLQTYTYQTLQDSTGSYMVPPYDKLPELHVVGAHYNWGGFDVVSDNYVTKFRSPVYHDSAFYNNDYYYNDDTTMQIGGNHIMPDGTRLKSYTSVSYPITHAGWFLTPKVGIHLSQYNTDWYDIPGTEHYPDTVNRAVPIMSLDTGMTFERNTTLFGNDSIQTLEPRIYYLRVPYRNQDDIPVYDTSLATFNFSQAFSENIFSGGWDRIANANQVTFGLTTRWLDADTGSERLSLSAAQRVYFEDQKVTLPGNDVARTDNTSDYLIGAKAALTDKLSVQFSGEFNPETNERNRITAGVRWEPKRLATINLGYRYERDPEEYLNPYAYADPEYVDQSREQAMISGQWPITTKWSIMGRYDYSIKDKRNTQSIFGVEYKGDCCWAARAVFQRYAVSSEDVNTAFFIQLELSGLGSLGTDPMSLLRDRIAGYQSVNNPIPEKTTFERYE